MILIWFIHKKWELKKYRCGPEKIRGYITTQKIIVSKISHKTIKQKEAKTKIPDPWLLCLSPSLSTVLKTKEIQRIIYFLYITPFYLPKMTLCKNHRIHKTFLNSHTCSCQSNYTIQTVCLCMCTSEHVCPWMSLCAFVCMYLACQAIKQSLGESLYKKACPQRTKDGKHLWFISKNK